MRSLVAAFLAGAFLFFTCAATTAQESGFTSLFDGKTLSGWTGGNGGYVVKEGAIVCDPKAKGGGNLYTEKEYANFELRFEFRLEKGSNNGIGIRAPKEGDAAFAGMEIQVLDDGDEIYKDIQPYQSHGSVYGVIAAKRGFLKPVGEWNSETIRIEGSKIKITLNGEVIVDGDIKEASKDGTIDKREHPGLKRDKGYICFCGHGAYAAFRNLQIKEL
jgi:Domain of Unknown Function (DUF1080)